MRAFSALALCVVVALGSEGCTTLNWVTGSAVVAADEHGGMVSRVTTFTQAGALEMAHGWCQRYGLDAQEVQVVFGTGAMEFACVPPPAT